MKTTLNLKSWLLVPVLALMAACGGGGDSTATTAPTTPTTPTTPVAPTLVSIAVTPASTTIAIGTQVQMTATGTYSDGKNSDITKNATWAAKGNVVSVVFSSGLVTGKAVGTETVTATMGTVSGSTDLTVKAPWTLVTAGGNFTIARKADGSLFEWGRNLFGQLGDNTTTDRATPALVVGAVTSWKMVAGGEQHTLAVRSDGTLWAWGYNHDGQLGDGTTADKASPVRIGTKTDWVYVAAGKAHSFAINKAGGLFAWGNNFSGQLGDGTVVPKLVPTQIIAPANAVWATIAAGETHSVGRLTNGTMYLWGGNESGQTCAAASATPVLTPTALPLTWVEVAAGARHTAAIRADGTLWTCGSNGSGQLGTLGPLPISSPLQPPQPFPWQVGTATNWARVAVGASHTLAVKADGTLWGWGSNSNGQVGNNSARDVTAPQQIGIANTWVAVTAGLRHSFGMQSDSTLWGWGSDEFGQQGDGNTTTVAVPAPVNLP
ncbi:MAG: Ig-like domain-containing protein [Pseudomonadota bacterium]